MPLVPFLELYSLDVLIGENRAKGRGIARELMYANSPMQQSEG